MFTRSGSREDEMFLNPVSALLWERSRGLLASFPKLCWGFCVGNKCKTEWVFATMPFTTWSVNVVCPNRVNLSQRCRSGGLRFQQPQASIQPLLQRPACVSGEHATLILSVSHNLQPLRGHVKLQKVSFCREVVVIQNKSASRSKVLVQCDPNIATALAFGGVLRMLHICGLPRTLPASTLAPCRVWAIPWPLRLEWPSQGQNSVLWLFE